MKQEWENYLISISYKNILLISIVKFSFQLANFLINDEIWNYVTKRKETYTKHPSTLI